MYMTNISTRFCCLVLTALDLNILSFILITIITGGSGCKDIKGIEISVCQRMDGMTSQLPIYYCVQRPQISLVPSVATCGTDGAQWTYGINWSEGDSSLEVVDGLEGKTIEG